MNPIKGYLNLHDVINLLQVHKVIIYYYQFSWDYILNWDEYRNLNKEFIQHSSNIAFGRNRSFGLAVDPLRLFSIGGVFFYFLQKLMFFTNRYFSVILIIDVSFDYILIW